ncbi:MAG TPA: hypothetical protein VIY70_01100 [Acidimicrobiia bacterium]
MSTGADAGVGCRTLSTALGALIGFAAGAAILGLTLIGNDACTSACVGFGFAAYAAGLPLSALFSFLGGSDLVVAFFTDVIVWIVAAVVVSRLVERRGSGIARPLISTMALAVAYGALISFGLERA